jgi:phospholipase/carboxylesterase
MGHMTLRPNLELVRGQFGDLDCTLAVPSGGKSPQFCVILCHGFGAPGTDLVPLAEELAELVPEQAGKIAYIFPQAPLDLGGGGYGFAGRAWWMVDVERFQRAVGNPRAIAELRAEVPPGMAESSQLLRGCLDDAARRTGVPISRTLLGGFSQGSMIATDVALRLSAAPAGLCIFSGALLAEHEWRPLAQNRGPLSVLQTHGRYDPLLPIDGAVALRDLLVESGLSVEFVAFDGPHTISMEGIDRCAALMRKAFGRGSDDE